MSKLYWEHDENSYDLYFITGDNETILLGSLVHQKVGWAFISHRRLGKMFVWMHSDNIEDSKRESEEIVENYYKCRVDKYTQLLSDFKNAREENRNGL